MMPAQTQPNLLPVETCRWHVSDARPSSVGSHTGRLYMKPNPQQGQGITEYCLIIVLASIALVTALGVFGSALADEFDGIVDIVISL